jgi:hypothetical protein
MSLVLLTTAGTGAAWNDLGGYPAQAGFALSDPALIARGQCWGIPNGLNWTWQGVGYPAAVYPMGTSVSAGIDENVRLLQQVYPHPWQFVLDGYSQGGIVVSHVWRDEICHPQGRLHDRLFDCLGVITYGNPCRAPGIAYGNTELWGHPVPDHLDGYVTGGISGPDCLHPEECLFPVNSGHPLAGRPAVFDFANPGDLYASAPINSDPWNNPTTVGHDETLIYNMVQNFNGKSLFSFIQTGIDLFLQPFSHVWPLCEAIYNGGLFASEGTNAPHWQYSSLPAINHLTSLGMEMGPT